MTGPLLATEVFAMPEGTRWTEVGGTRVADTPDCRPSFYGHRVVLPGPPGVGGWAKPFALWREHHTGKGVQTAYVVWEDCSTAPAAPQAPPGVTIAPSRGLVLHGRPRPAPVPADAHLRPLETDADWAALFDLSVAVHPFAADDPGKDYLRWDLVGRRRRVARGGRQWGAFVGERLVGATALVFGTTSARYQDVLVHPDFRRLGFASALVSRAAAHGRARAPRLPQWIAAEADGAAEAIYRSLGFVPETTVFEVSLPAPPTVDDLDRTVAQLEGGTLALGEWDHRTRLLVAATMLEQAGGQLLAALPRLRRAEAGLFEVAGADRRPHETRLRGLLELVRADRRRRPDMPLVDFALHASLYLGSETIFARHWSPGLLARSGAAVTWTEPDRAPLPH